MSVLPFVTETEYLTAIAGVLAALIILLVSGLVFIYTQRKKKSNTTKGTKQHFLQPMDVSLHEEFLTLLTFSHNWTCRFSLNRSMRCHKHISQNIILFLSVVVKHDMFMSTEEEDEQELTYADVKVMPRQGRQIPQMTEIEVEYGQVKFSSRPPRTARPREDDGVYAKVHRDR